MKIVIPEFNKSGGPAESGFYEDRQKFIHCAGPNVRHNFSPILSKYFLLPTSSMFRMFVGSIIFMPMFGL